MNIMKEQLVRLSKTMSHALRHKPTQYGLTLDADGWVAVEDLLSALRQHRSAWAFLQEKDLEDVIAYSEKQRFEMRDGNIRAFYGHSTPTKVEHEVMRPPAILYHGTTPEAARAIRGEGLKPMRRQYVHLSADKATALEVARRRTNRPVVLLVDAAKAYQQGIHFYLGNEMVWLADAIPGKFIIGEEG